MEEEYQSLISTLPVSKGWLLHTQYLYQGSWYDEPTLRGTLIAQNQCYGLEAPSSSPNILLASHPKTGTTWLKSLLFALTTRTQYFQTGCSSAHPLLTSNPHDCVSSIELHALKNPSNPVPKNTSLLSTHINFHSLPDSLKSSGYRIVYVYRDPKDAFISMWHFANQYRKSTDPSELLSLEEATDHFCDGKSNFGPYWDHVLSYWEESIKTPEKLLFVGYEELKTSPVDCLKRLASFIGHPFSAEEEKDGVAESILDLCSFKKMRDMEVNKTDLATAAMPNSMKMTNGLFFRKAEIGDHKNYLTKETIDRFDKITKMKWGEVGFVGKY